MEKVVQRVSRSAAYTHGTFKLGLPVKLCLENITELKCPT